MIENLNSGCENDADEQDFEGFVNFLPENFLGKPGSACPEAKPFVLVNALPSVFHKINDSYQIDVYL